MACASQEMCAPALQVDHRQRHYMSYMPDFLWRLSQSWCDTQRTETPEGQWESRRGSINLSPCRMLLDSHSSLPSPCAGA